MRNHLLGRRIIPRRGSLLLSDVCSLEVCDVRYYDLGFPFALEISKDLFTDTVLVKLWFHGVDDIVDNSTINGGLKEGIRVTRPSSIRHGYIL